MSEENKDQSDLTTSKPLVIATNQKKRHGCFTAYLVLLVWTTLGFFWIIYSNIRSPFMPTWQIYHLALIAVFNLIWAIALIKWKMWGFWGYCLTSIAIILINLIFRDGGISALSPLLGIAILYGVLQIGGENKGWTQLEGADYLNQLLARLNKKDSQPKPDYPVQAKNGITPGIQKHTSQSPTTQSTVQQESDLSLPPDTGVEDKTKRRNRILKILGSGCLLIPLCCILGFIGIAASGLLSNVGVTRNIDRMPKWSPDGSHIAFVSQRDGNTDIYLMDTDGSNVTPLTEDPFALLSFMASSARDFSPSWSPDGKHIAFSSERDDYLWSLTNLNIYVMDADGSNPTLISETGLFSVPEWSPDGKHIALTVSGGNQEDLDIYIMDADGTNLKRLTHNPSDDAYPSWSPGGERIVFASERDDNWEIYIMDVDGSNLMRLTEDSATDIEPDWSPDGNHIVFSSDRDGDWDIYLMNIDDSSVTLLTKEPAHDNNPSWSPNGEQIAFASDRDGDWEVYVMDVDGSNLKQLTHND